MLLLIVSNRKRVDQDGPRRHWPRGGVQAFGLRSGSAHDAVGKIAEKIDRRHAEWQRGLQGIHLTTFVNK